MYHCFINPMWQTTLTDHYVRHPYDTFDFPVFYVLMILYHITNAALAVFIREYDNNTLSLLH